MHIVSVVCETQSLVHLNYITKTETEKVGGD